MPITNRQWILQTRPTGLLAPETLKLTESPISSLGEGLALARVKYLSLDPTMRVWMTDIPQYMHQCNWGK
jgi:NADPH-dependent curcumin reductase CurA